MNEKRDLGQDYRPTPHRSHKDRRRWCRGKPGVEHVLERREGVIGWGRATCQTVPDWGQWRKGEPRNELSATRPICTEADVCVNCGKQFWIESSQCHLAGSHDKDGLTWKEWRNRER